MEEKKVNVAAYCWEALGPDKINDQRITEIQESGLDTVMLFAVHIGKPDIPRGNGLPPYKWGDLVFNNAYDLLVSDGRFNPEEQAKNRDLIALWPAQIARLKKGGSKVSEIFFSIGGGEVNDYTTIRKC
jgi:hypothetical protein